MSLSLSDGSSGPCIQGGWRSGTTARETTFRLTDRGDQAAYSSYRTHTVTGADHATARH